MQVSLGRSVADEIRPGLHKVSKVGLHSMLVGEIYCCSNIDLNWIFNVMALYSFCLFVFLFSFYMEILVFVVPIYQMTRSKGTASWMHLSASLHAALMEMEYESAFRVIQQCARRFHFFS